MLSAAEVIRRLELVPHPEGGHFRETYRDPRLVEDRRAASTAIYFLLTRGERSHWHRIDAVEVWHWYAGAPLALSIASNGKAQTFELGPELTSNATPQLIVPANAWQMAVSLGEWTLCGCTVAPGFEFGKFELAPRDWTPGDGTRRAP